MTGDVSLPDTASQFSTRVFFSGLIVETEQAPTTIVAIGDSLTDGNGSTPVPTPVGRMFWPSDWREAVSAFSMPVFPVAVC